MQQGLCPISFCLFPRKPLACANRIPKSRRHLRNEFSLREMRPQPCLRISTVKAPKGPQGQALVKSRAAAKGIPTKLELRVHLPWSRPFAIERRKTRTFRPRTRWCLAAYSNCKKARVTRRPSWLARDRRMGRSTPRMIDSQLSNNGAPTDGSGGQ